MPWRGMEITTFCKSNISDASYSIRPLLGGSTKNRPSAVDFDCRRPIEGEINRRRSIEGEIDRQRSIEREKGKKKKKRKEEKKKEYLAPARRPHSRANRPVAGGPHTGNLADRYVPPVPDSKCRNCKPWLLDTVILKRGGTKKILYPSGKAPYQAVHTGPPANRYVDHPLSGEEGEEEEEKNTSCVALRRFPHEVWRSQVARAIRRPRAKNRRWAIPSPLNISPRGEKDRGDGKEIARGRRIVQAKSSIGLQILPPLVDTAQNRSLPPDNNRRRSKSTVIDRFQVVTGRKQPQSMVPPDSEWSAYRLASGLAVFNLNLGFKRRSIEGESDRGGKRGIVLREDERNGTAYRIYRTCGRRKRDTDEGNANPNPIPTPPPPAGDASPSGEATLPPPPPSSAHRPFTSLSQVDADLALARALQEQAPDPSCSSMFESCYGIGNESFGRSFDVGDWVQERAYAMLRMNGVDCSDYGSYGYEEEEVEEGVGDEPGQVIEDDAGNIEGSDYTRTLSIPMILMLTMRHSQGRCRILRSSRWLFGRWPSQD
ncbi:hypothetical protein GW17_00025140 [Ensete ventricosum]|nr:hypothetical protein GW17_00025140 [Ensete ventricosum]